MGGWRGWEGWRREGGRGERMRRDSALCFSFVRGLNREQGKEGRGERRNGLFASEQAEVISCLRVSGVFRRAFMKVVVPVGGWTALSET